MRIKCIIDIMYIHMLYFPRYVVISCTQWWEVEGIMGGYATLDCRKIHQGNAGKLGNYPILSVLPDKFARFLFEYHSHRFESLDLPQLPADRSDFDVHGALLDDKVQSNCNTLHFAQS